METNKVILLINLLNNEIDNYKNKSINYLLEELKINSNSKNINRMIVDRIIEKSKNKDKIKELLKSLSCVIKTVSLEYNDLLKESMSLNVFKYEDIYIEDWETSTLRKYFDTSIFMFIIFKKNGHESFLKKFKIWIMPKSILDDGVKDTWEKTKKLICQGKIVNYIDKQGRYITYFPTSGDTKYIHVRPHAKNKNDTLPLPVVDKTTGKSCFMKHSFWLNRNFVKKIIVEDKFYE